MRAQYNDYVKKELEREKWELENYPEGEMVEMIELFQRRGMSREDAEEVIVRMAKYKNFFINLMMTEELALPLPADDEAAAPRDKETKETSHGQHGANWRCVSC